MSASKGRYCQNVNCSHLDDPGNKNRIPKRLVDPDWHPYCLRCLPLDHDPDNCSICIAFSNKTRDARERAVNEFKETGVWPDQVNSKSLDKERVKLRASSKDKSQSLEKPHSSSKVQHGGKKDFSAVMVAASQVYQKQGRKIKISSQVSPPKDVVPTLTPAIPITPPTPMEDQEVESENSITQEEMDQASASIAQEALAAAEREESQSDLRGPRGRRGVCRGPSSKHHSSTSSSRQTIVT